MALLILISSFIFIITGCWSSRELNTLATSICTGIDKTENGYRVTQQILNPKTIAAKKPTNEAPVIIYSEEGKDIFSALRKITTISPRKIYYSHLRMVVIGEAAARDGLDDIIDYFTRDHEFRTDFFFVVAKNTTAYELLHVLTPFETVPGIEMYDSLKASQKVWAPTKSVKIIELINSLTSEGKNPVLTGVEIPKDNTDIDSIDNLKKSNPSSKLSIKGLGAFKKDKLVGWLNEDESKGYNYITDNVKNTVGHMEYGEKISISFEVTSAKSKITANLIDNKPAINVKIDVLQNIGEVDSQFDVSTEESKKTINALSEETIARFCDQAVNKAQTELETDIFGFGEAIHKKYPELWSGLKEDWNSEFVDLPVKISVDVETKKIGQLTKPYFLKGD